MMRQIPTKDNVNETSGVQTYFQSNCEGTVLENLIFVYT